MLNGEGPESNGGWFTPTCGDGEGPVMGWCVKWTGLHRFLPFTSLGSQATQRPALRPHFFLRQERRDGKREEEGR